MDIKNLRNEIDNIDNQIIDLLAKRKNIVKEIAKLKGELDKPILDEKREEKIIERLKTRAKENSLDKNFIDSLYKLILENSRNEQERSK